MSAAGPWGETVELQTLCLRVVSGGTPSRAAPEYFDGGTIPWMKTGEVKRGFVYSTEEHITELGLENSSAKLIPSNSLIVAMYGDGDTAGNVAINKVPLTTNQACCNFVVDPAKADYRFLYYYLKGNYGNLVNLKLGGSQQNLNAATLKRFPVPAIPVPAQTKIAAMLSAYDDLIATNQRRIALLETMAEEIYREWFVRMRCSADRRGTKCELRSFDDLCVLQRGFDLPDSAMQSGDVPVIASTSIKGFHNIAKVNPPVVTTGRSGSLGTVLLTNCPAWPLNTALYVKSFKGNSPYLVYFTLKNLHLENFNAGAGVPTLNRNHLSGIRIPLPGQAAQNRFDELVGPMIRSADVLRDAIDCLRKQRDALLPRLISGKLKVDHLDIHFPPSMQDKVTA